MIKSDAQKLIDYNFPEVHYQLDRADQMRAVEQHSPLLERGLW